MLCFRLATAGSVWITSPMELRRTTRIWNGAVFKLLFQHDFTRSRATFATRSALTRVMQRWSMGHSRLRQGLHSTGSRTTRASGPVGPVVVSSVAPKIATVGTPRAEAMCMPPESFERYTRQAAASLMYWASEVSPAKFFTGVEMAVAMDAHSSRSSLDPKM